jgi:hypothetical protein
VYLKTVCCGELLGLRGKRQHRSRKLHSENHPNIIWVIKLRSIKWVGHEARTEKRRCIQGFGGETCGKESTWIKPGIDGWIMLRWIFRKWDGGAQTGLI